jgi:ParB-like chromosome segregation protein Spo0J
MTTPMHAAEPVAPPEHCINEAPPAPDNSKRLVSVAAILADDRAQPRAALMDDQVAEYAEEMGRGDQFPPLVVFQDKEQRYWLADGFHRYHAAVCLGLKTIECVVHQGGLRDAVLFSRDTAAARRSYG